MIKVAVDLTWVRHKKVGGTESCVRNLLNGIQEINPQDIKVALILARDNASSFNMYSNACFEALIGDVDSSNQVKRVIWQNRKLEKLLRDNSIKVLLEPIYSIPFLGMKNIKVISTIHDLQAIHYPEYFSKFRVMWMKANWKNTVSRSNKIVAISEYVKNDIVLNFRVPERKVLTIYDAIDLKTEECSKDSELEKYGVEKNNYYYTVSSLLPHKNLKTIISAIAKLKKGNSEFFFPLVISGVGGGAKDELIELAESNNVVNDIILTPFVDNAERNMLYKNCRVFLFPSIFEGFGMPPIEAMAMGTPVLTTRCTSLEEVTGGLLNYIDDPLDSEKWSNSLKGILSVPDEIQKDALLNKYSRTTIAKEYLSMFRELNE